jgi:disulfide bond formation protein DsbB
MKVQLSKNTVDFWILVAVAALLATLGRPTTTPPLRPTGETGLAADAAAEVRHTPQAGFAHSGHPDGAPNEGDAATVAGAGDGTAAPTHAQVGRSSYLQSCAACHGALGQGMPHQGPDLRRSRFVAERDDAQLATFVRGGRMPNDRYSIMQMFMPPSGGNPALKESDVRDIISHIRQLQSEAAGGSATAKGGGTPWP